MARRNNNQGGDYSTTAVKQTCATGCYGRFWDLTVERVEPEGSAVAGQKLVGWSRALCRRWPIIGQVQEVDAERHQILFRMSLPFGLVSNNRIMCSRVDERSCTLRFG